MITGIEGFKDKFVDNLHSLMQERLCKLHENYLSVSKNPELDAISQLISKLTDSNKSILLESCLNLSLSNSSGLNFRNNLREDTLFSFLNVSNRTTGKFHEIDNRKIDKLKLLSLLSDEIIRRTSGYLFSNNFSECEIHNYSNGLLVKTWIKFGNSYQVHILQCAELHYECKKYPLLSYTDSLQLSGVKSLVFNSVNSEKEMAEFSHYLSHLCTDFSDLIFLCYEQTISNLDKSLISHNEILNSISIVLPDNLSIKIETKFLFELYRDINDKFSQHVQFLKQYSEFSFSSHSYRDFFNNKNDFDAKLIMKSLCKRMVSYSCLIACDQNWTYFDQNVFDDLQYFINNSESIPIKPVNEAGEKVSLSTIKSQLKYHLARSLSGFKKVESDSSELIFRKHSNDNWIIEAAFDLGGFYQLRASYTLYYVDKSTGIPYIVYSDSGLGCFGINELYFDNITRQNMTDFFNFLISISDKVFSKFQEILR